VFYTEYVFQVAPTSTKFGSVVRGCSLPAAACGLCLAGARLHAGASLWRSTIDSTVVARRSLSFDAYVGMRQRRAECGMRNASSPARMLKGIRTKFANKNDFHLVYHL
jgi:hypothetical protein